MSDTETLFAVLRQSADRKTAEAIEHMVRHAPDRALCRVNALVFAAEHGIDEETAIAAFLHAAKLGLFELSWNVLCPGCGGVLDSGATLKTVRSDAYSCALCAAGYEPTLDEMVEVTFTVSPRVRHIAAHDPDTLPVLEYCRQIYWGSGLDLPPNLEQLFDEVTLETLELAPGERAIVSLQLPAAFVIVFDPVTHATQFLDVQGEPTTERRGLTMAFNTAHTPNETVRMQPGPLRIQFENNTERRVLPGLWLANDTLHAVMGRRRPFVTAKRLLTNQVFRDLFRTDTLGKL